MPLTLAPRHLIAGCLFILFNLFLWHTYSTSSAQLTATRAGSWYLGKTINQTPKDAVSTVSKLRRQGRVRKIMGLVFYGRRSTVSILECYLKRNLVKYGGVLDGVIFLERTQDQADLALLDKIIASEPDYQRQKVDLSKGGYASSYDEIEDDILYVKMDDDILFVEDSVIPSLVQTKLERPDIFVVSANVVNQPVFSWLHWNLGAVKPYLPEVNKPGSQADDGGRVDWRASRLPAWEGKNDFDFDTWESPNHEKHRWLPVRGKTTHILDNTPITKLEYSFGGAGWSNWRVAAQVHYSFLENLEKDELWRYRYHMWDFQLQRVGIQFIAMMGSDINAAKPIGTDDEHHFVVEMPTRLGRHAVADGRGVVTHNAYYPQVDGGFGMRTTDILDRYRSYAMENVCKGKMLWTSEADDVGIHEQMKKQTGTGSD